MIQVNVAFEVTTGYESAENNDSVALASNDVKKALTIVDALVGKFEFVPTFNFFVVLLLSLLFSHINTS